MGKGVIGTIESIMNFETRKSVAVCRYMACRETREYTSVRRQPAQEKRPWALRAECVEMLEPAAMQRILEDIDRSAAEFEAFREQQKLGASARRSKKKATEDPEDGDQPSGKRSRR